MNKSVKDSGHEEEGDGCDKWKDWMVVMGFWLWW